MHTIGAWDVLPDGRVVPVEHDFSRPPEGLSRQVRRQWERRYRDFISQFKMPVDLAWYRATTMTTGRSAYIWPSQ